jgi:Sulfotransferase domain
LCIIGTLLSLCTRLGPLMEEHSGLPNFLIVGAMKAGTTSLSRYLDLHPDIHMPKKEVHFFDREENYQKGEGWYREQLALGYKTPPLPSALSLGEKTPTYSFNPKCAERIHKDLPGVKLVWILREPVARAWSNYLHAVKKGAEIRPFEIAVKEEAQSIERELFRGYVERSKYVDQVRRFLEYYRLEDMHFLLFEDLLANPSAELDRLTQFLGVSPFEQNLPVLHSNPTRMPPFPKLLYHARRFGGTGGLLFRTLNRLSNLMPVGGPEIPQSLAAELASVYEVCNEDLAELAKLDLSGWKNQAGRNRQ